MAFSDYRNFEKNKIGNWCIFQNKNYDFIDLEKTITNPLISSLVDKTPVAASKFANVFKCKLRLKQSTESVYLKEFLYRSGFDKFKHLFRSGRAQRSVSASMMLTENGFETAEILAFGWQKALIKKKIFVITKDLQGCQDTYQIFKGFEKANDKELHLKKLFIKQLGTTVGQLHEKGIVHGDLRLGNVLSKFDGQKWRFNFIDNERTRKYKRIPGKLIIKNLVQINLFKSSALSNTDRLRFYRAYCNSYKEFSPEIFTPKVLAKTFARVIDQINKGKFSKRFKFGNCKGEISKALNVDTIRSDIENLDSIMAAGKIIKSDANATLCKTNLWGYDVLIKRYNNKSLFHHIRQTIKNSDAQNAWRNTQILNYYGTKSSLALCYVNFYKGRLLTHSYSIQSCSA